MSNSLQNRIAEWGRDVIEKDIITVGERITYLAEHLFKDYEPTKRAGCLEFMDRLEHWLDCIPGTLRDDQTNADQKTLLRSVQLLFFVGQDEFRSLHQSAFNGPITRWLIDQHHIRIDDPTAHQMLKTAVAETWFCPATDSMKIAEFYHINGISGTDLRPGFRALSELGTDPTAVRDYMEDNHFNKLVLLEDFVGSGSQMEEAIPFACQLDPDYPVLACPLIICEDGLKKCNLLKTQYPQLTVEPVLLISKHSCVKEIPHPLEPESFRKLRELIVRLQALVAGPTPTHYYGPFGYPPRDGTGAMLIMHTNAPDNSLPIYHYSSTTWKPIFPRASRL